MTGAVAIDERVNLQVLAQPPQTNVACGDAERYEVILHSSKNNPHKHLSECRN